MGVIGDTTIIGWTNVSGTVGTTAARYTATSTPLARAVRLMAHPNNAGKIYVGFSNAVTKAEDGTSTDGWPLVAGDYLELELDDLNKLWMIGTAAGQIYTLHYVPAAA